MGGFKRKIVKENASRNGKALRQYFCLRRVYRQEEEEEEEEEGPTFSVNHLKKQHGH